ncbi:conserved hypothetical protein [Leishmania major strain Friedlin]|uniref:Uncharacterized protein n=1 Tax=Leishmania major TaxID=5664 RepID=Q4Q4G8_LEIMA|nr:conserved hypothetical protein [Leishmania major strain Friedlin]CAG9580600.1 hypothetical_protein_-_conserved [Leishmania major strain Friedlin]CAJ05975.1 conserved hypothetical protein [Leishmania major strain Friedlin]|eukprot:XP_001685778.1 conserved hypothetical protein [Leishmania major strain Friedlin]
MSALRDVPGYATMKDYYDSEYVPHDLLTRYHALQVELQKRREQHFVTLSQTSGLAVPYDALAVTSTLPHLKVNLSSKTRCANPHQQQMSPRSLRSPHRVVQRSGSSLVKSGSGGQTETCLGSGNRCVPRARTELEEIYAPRHRSHNGVLGGCTLMHDSVARGSSARRTASPSASSSVGADAASPLQAALPISAPQRRSRPQRQRCRSLPKACTEGLTPSDPYEAAAEARRQERFLSESKRLGKPFVPSGSGGLDVPTRFMLGDCVKMLYRSIAPNWWVAAPVVVSTAEDLIAVYFFLEKLSRKQVTELLQYMNACLKYNDAVREFSLSKVEEGWDVLTDDGHVLYTFRPPWVKKRVFLPDTVSPPHVHE